ncbi:hypothetical protein [Undibacterium oligocarboniphilum]|uniref:Uncharacterized protein n=1 Tax=Undibacterium oligocarboniphilum TaxID=666702 RepID=A0A850QNH9_9BURK|nr:hypothetical protein [Undibacterium oligocarboniphilum]MBC3871491.1 hypothetical protein [Undibacterium oligocarboniphilum]NVO78933.1 hypothetical protein [Undibacterium oligocarboniphilum]
MNYTFELPLQIFILKHRNIRMYWMGSFTNLVACTRAINEWELDPLETLVVMSGNLPAMTADEHAAQVQDIQSEIDELGKRLLTVRSLDEKVYVKFRMKEFELKLKQFRLHYFNFVKQGRPANRPVQRRENYAAANT